MKMFLFFFLFCSTFFKSTKSTFKFIVQYIDYMYYIFNLPEHIKKLILDYIPLWWMPHGTIAKINTYTSLLDGIILYNHIWCCNWFYHKTGCFTLNNKVMTIHTKYFTITKILQINNVAYYK